MRGSTPLFDPKERPRAQAALEVGGTSSLYGIDVLNGRATRIGAFPTGTKVVGLAIPLLQL